MLAVKIGKSTDIFKTSKYAASAPPEHCFSLILKTRTLDLQANSEELRNSWAQAMSQAVESAKKRSHVQWLMSKREQSIANRRSITGRQATPEALQYATTGRIRSQTTSGFGTVGPTGSPVTSGGNRARAITSATVGSGHALKRPDLLAAFSPMKTEENSFTETNSIPEGDEKDAEEEEVDGENPEDVGPSLPAVIKAMAKRNSVQMTADHMRLNMARQQALQQHKQKQLADTQAKKPASP